MARKRGKLSTDEEKFIVESANSLTLNQISLHLNRTEGTVKDYCIRNNLTYTGMSEERYDDTVLRQKLEERPYWGEVQQQFTDLELEYFVITWVRMVKQFREDILYTEELAIKQWITLDILCNRIMKDRKLSVEQIERMQRLLDAEYDLPNEDRNVERIAALETEVSMIRNSLSSYTTEHSKLLDKIKDIQRDLKAARADRVKKVEDSKSSWAGFMRALEDDSTRQKVGEDIAIMKLAKNEARKQFSKNHKYEDGQIDQPILNAETAKD